MSAIAGGILAGMISNVAADQKALNQEDAERRMMMFQNRLNNANALNAYSQQVQGAKMAGLNPAMLNGATPNVAAPVSKGTAQMAENVEFDQTLGMLDSQKRNLDAQTAKLAEETRAEKNINDQTDAANDAATRGYIDDFNREIDDLEKTYNALQDKDSVKGNQILGRIKNLQAMRDKMIDPNYRGALGIAKGAEAARSFTKARLGQLTDYLNGNMNNAVARRKLDNGTILALSQMDKLTRDKLAKEIDSLSQAIAESESREELNDQTVLKLQTDIEAIGDTILRAHLNDENYIRFMAENGPTEEVKFLFKKNLDNLTETEARKLKYEIGKGIAVGLATGGAAGAAIGAGSKAVGKVIDKNKKTKNPTKYFQGSDGKYYPEIQMPGPPGPLSDNPFPYSKGSGGSGVGNFRF